MTVDNVEFDFQKALKGIQEGRPFTGKDGVLTSLIKNLAEAALEAELDSHLAQEISGNRRNGRTKKTIKSLDGNFELETPRDRDGTFSPKIIKKHQTTLSDEIEQKIIALYGLGMSYNDISAHLKEIYGLEISTGTLSAVTDKIIHTVKEWQARPLESLYPIVWLDAIHYKIKENGRVGSKAVYTILGVNIEGRKEVLGLYISENEGANFWLQVLTDLSNRGVNDILIACVDGLKGFPEAIETIFPETEVQLCVVHQIRNSLKYVGSKNQKEFMADLKRVYKAVNKELAESELDVLENKWNDKYPIVIKSWRNNWERLSQYFKYPEEIRRIIYTTNTIEAVHRQFRKLTKTKGAFPNQDSLLKLLYMGIQNASKKWTMPVQNWSLTISQLAIFFEGRLDKELKI
jgi:putative transposase